MTPRAWRLWLCVACVASGIGCGEAAPPETADREAPERIFLFVVDTLRRDHLSTYGAARSTPRIDALADRGQRFGDAVASFHQTTMSMAALFTGLTPSIEAANSRQPLPWTSESWCGLSRFGRDGDRSCVPQRLRTVAEELRDAGYATIGVNPNRLLFDPAGYSQGFDQWIEVGKGVALDEDTRARRRSAEFVNAAVIQALEQRASDRFFLYVHWLDVHDHRLAGGSYADAVVAFDTVFGELLDAIAEMGLLENSVIFFTSDHGESLSEATAIGVAKHHFGNPAFEALLRIPLLVSPAIFDAPERFVRSQDIAALVLAAAGVVPRDDEPAASGPAADELFLSELHYQTYRRGRFKSTRKRSDERAVLFDLEADPGETRDVAAEHPAVVERHARRVEALAELLASEAVIPDELSGDDLEALRALGYAE